MTPSRWFLGLFALLIGLFCLSCGEEYFPDLSDTDDDGISNSRDTDDDNDGVLYIDDSWPLNPNAY